MLSKNISNNITDNIRDNINCQMYLLFYGNVVHYYYEQDNKRTGVFCNISSHYKR